MRGLVRRKLAERSVGLTRFLGRLARGREGSTMIEFSLVALPFFALLMAILETGVMMMTNSLVQSGLDSAARMVRVGLITSPATGSCPAAGTAATIPAAFSNAITAGMLGLGGSLNLVYDVRSYASFSAANTVWAPTYDAQGNPTNNCFDTGGSAAFVVVRVGFTYKFMTPGLGVMFGDPTRQSVDFVYATAFRNEPF